MKIKSIKFSRFEGDINEWSLEGKPFKNEYSQEATFGNINLIVGKNASGKTQTIKIINFIADIVALHTTVDVWWYSKFAYHIFFEQKENYFEYTIKVENYKIVSEILIENEVEKFNRQKQIGKIWNKETNSYLPFEIDENLSVFSKKDKIQYPFLEPLHTWGKNLKIYEFGGTLGKDKVIENGQLMHTQLKSDQIPIPIIAEIAEKANSKLKTQIIEDMQKVGYDLESIGLETIYYQGTPLAVGIGIKEKGVANIITQLEMSQGMFRALSLLIQLNYSLLNNIASCILIDDIGEGLDYERSQKIIDLIIDKLKNSSVQIIMTTNDRFIMNNIPLKHWSVIHRIPKKSLIYNYQNSKEVFDEFKYTGLSNFDFLSSEFYFEDIEQEVE